MKTNPKPEPENMTADQRESLRFFRKLYQKRREQWGEACVSFDGGIHLGEGVYLYENGGMEVY